MGNALIGYTGFVGGNLLSQSSFEFLYNSQNLSEIRERDFDLLVCAAPSGVKWRANKYPHEDYSSVKKLMDELSTVTSQRFVLLSTTDVFSEANPLDEDSVIELDKLPPYGRHRRMLEIFVAQQFSATTIRLPALFGKGLRKNSIYDLLHGRLEFLHPDGTLQYYNLDWVWADVQRAFEHQLKVLNLATEPICIREVAKEVFDIDFNNCLSTPVPHYDMRTKYAALWGMADPYLYSRDTVMSDLKSFVKTFHLE